MEKENPKPFGSLQDHGQDYRPESIIIYAYNKDLVKNYDNICMSISLNISTFHQTEKGTYYELKKTKGKKEYSLLQILKGRRKITIVAEELNQGKKISFALQESSKETLKNRLCELSPQEMAEVLFQKIDKTVWRINIIFDVSRLGVRQSNSGTTFISIFSQRVLKELSKFKVLSQKSQLKNIVVQGRGGLVNRENRDYIIPLDYVQLRKNIKFTDEEQLEKVIIPLSKFMWTHLNLTDQEVVQQIKKEVDDPKIIQFIQSTYKYFLPVFKKPFHVLDPKIVIKQTKTGKFVLDNKQQDVVVHTSGPLGRNQTITNDFRFDNSQKIKRFISPQQAQERRDQINNILMSLSQKEIKMIPYIVEQKLCIYGKTSTPQQLRKLMLQRGIIQNIGQDTQQTIQRIGKAIRKVTPQEMVAWHYYKNFQKLEHFNKLSKAQNRLLQNMDSKYKSILCQMLLFSEIHRPQSKHAFLIGQNLRRALKTIQQLKLTKELSIVDPEIFEHYQENLFQVKEHIKQFKNKHEQKIINLGKKEIYPPYQNLLEKVQLIQLLQDYDYKKYYPNQSFEEQPKKIRNGLKQIYQQYVKCGAVLGSWTSFRSDPDLCNILNGYKNIILDKIKQKDLMFKSYQQIFINRGSSKIDKNDQEFYEIADKYIESIQSFTTLKALKDKLEKHGQSFSIQILNHYKQQLENLHTKLQEKITVKGKVQKHQQKLIRNIRKISDLVTNYDYSLSRVNQMKWIYFNQSEILNNLKLKLNLNCDQMNGICFGLTQAFNYDHMNNVGVQLSLRRFKTLDMMTKLLQDNHLPQQLIQKFQSIFLQIRNHQQGNVGAFFPYNRFDSEFNYVNNTQIPITDAKEAILDKMKIQTPYHIGLKGVNKYGRQTYHSISIIKKGDDKFHYFDCNNTIKTNISTQEIIKQLKISSIGLSQEIKQLKIYSINSTELNNQNQNVWLDKFKIFEDSLQIFLNDHNASLQFRRALGEPQQKVKCIKYNLEQLKNLFKPGKQTAIRQKKVLILQMEGDKACTFSSKAMIERYKQNCQLILQGVQGLEQKSYQWNSKTKDVQIKPVCQDLIHNQKLDIKIVGHGSIEIDQNGKSIAKLGDQSAIQIVEKIKKLIAGKKAIALKIELIGCNSAHQQMAFEVGRHLQSIGKTLSINDSKQIELIAYQHNIQVTEQGKIIKELDKKKQKLILENQASKIRIRQINNEVHQVGISQKQRKELNQNLDKLIDNKVLSEEESEELRARRRKNSSKFSTPQQIFANRYHLQDKLQNIKQVVEKYLQKEELKGFTPDYMSFSKTKDGFKMKVYSKQNKMKELFLKEEKSISQWHQQQTSLQNSFFEMGQLEGYHTGLSLYYLYQGLVGLINMKQNFTQLSLLNQINMIANGIQTVHGAAQLIKKGMMSFEKTFQVGAKLHNVMALGKVIPNLMRVVNPIANIINLYNLWNEYKQNKDQHGIIISQMLITSVFLIIDVVEIFAAFGFAFASSIVSCGILGPLGLVLGVALIALSVYKQITQQQKQLKEMQDNCKMMLYQMIKPALDLQKKLPLMQKNKDNVVLSFQTKIPLLVIDLLSQTITKGNLYADNFSNANGVRIHHITPRYNDQPLIAQIVPSNKLQLYSLIQQQKKVHMKHYSINSEEEKHIIIKLPAYAQDHLHQRFGGQEKQYPTQQQNNGTVQQKHYSQSQREKAEKIFQKIKNFCQFQKQKNSFIPYYQRVFQPQENIIAKILLFSPAAMILSKTTQARLTSLQSNKVSTTIQVFLEKKTTFLIQPNTKEDSQNLTYLFFASQKHYDLYLLGTISKLTIELNRLNKNKSLTTWGITFEPPIRQILDCFLVYENYIYFQSIIHNGKIIDYTFRIKYQVQMGQINFLLTTTHSIMEKIVIKFQPKTKKMTLTKITGANKQVLQERFMKTGPKNPKLFYQQFTNFLYAISGKIELNLPLNFTIDNQFCSIQACKNNKGFQGQIPCKMLSNLSKQSGMILFVFQKKGESKFILTNFLNIEQKLKVIVDPSYQIFYLSQEKSSNLKILKYYVIENMRKVIKKVEIFEYVQKQSHITKLEEFCTGMLYDDGQLFQELRKNIKCQQQLSSVFSIAYQKEKKKQQRCLSKYFYCLEKTSEKKWKWTDIETYEKAWSDSIVVGRIYQIYENKPYYTENIISENFYFNSTPLFLKFQKKLNLVVDFVSCQQQMQSLHFNLIKDQQIYLTIFKKNPNSTCIFLDQDIIQQDIDLKIKKDKVKISLKKLKASIQVVSNKFTNASNSYICYKEKRIPVKQFKKRQQKDRQSKQNQGQIKQFVEEKKMGSNQKLLNLNQ